MHVMSVKEEKISCFPLHYFLFFFFSFLFGHAPAACGLLAELRVLAWN